MSPRPPSRWRGEALPDIWRAAWVWIGDDGAGLRDADVAVADGAVVAVGRELAGRVVAEWPGALIPGLVNAHAHLEYGDAFADLAGADLDFPEWITELTRRRHLTTDAQWYDQACAGAAQLLAAGVTCVADVVTHGPALTAAARSGLAGVSYVEAVGAGDASWPQEEQRVRALLDSAAGERSVGVSPHTLYSLSGAAVAGAVRLARQRGLRLHPHLAETAAEDEFVRHGRGRLAERMRAVGLAHELLDSGGAARSPAYHLDSLGGLGSDVHVAHGVHLDAADRALLRRRGTAVALCPRSNAILRAGQAPVAALRAEGNPVAVGTDSLASSPDLDLLAELRALRGVARGQASPVEGLDEWLLAAATAGGAAALGASRSGRLAAGARADLVLVDSDPAEGARGVVHGQVVTTVLAGSVAAGSVAAP